ncbi:Ribulokinase [Paenibacillus solanacearum]|uniref:Ribulokinase n=1 Tax=Paenibacillus solanacearum TaxID=2048548 RepID=A0A916K1W5_9BACL|nr:ribulokinase [Paenibacillus solanacearum]CAG7615950.1 Ribulokinase [Paenibacillus solanacearum]
MGSTKYAIGIDYGTESGRALLADISTGEEIAVHVTPYAHGVMTEKLPGSGTKLGHEWALQHPQDYLDVLYRSVPEVIRRSGIDPADVVGIGVDFTSCTILPVDAQGMPLCFDPALAGDPHSWVKLWKHHAAQEEADAINAHAARAGQTFLARYGGKLSSEWMLPKLWQVLREAPELYARADRFMEAADWVPFMMTGEFVRSSCAAGYKALWHKEDGYPAGSFFAELDPGLADVFETKLRGTIVPLGTKVGRLTAEMAERMGLRPGIAVAAGIVDAHAGVPGCGVVTPGRLVMAMGTSTCHLLLSDEELLVEGICGVVADGIVPGFYGYEAGQPAVGDIFAWYVDRAVPAYVREEAAAEGISVHEWLERRAAGFEPGENGLLALDWWNGNRSVLDDSDLSGLIVGLTLQTKPEEIYRALIEATAFGTRRIIDAFQDGGIQVTELVACGGLPQRNRMLMQIYADVTGREIRIAASSQTPALGSAIYGAVAAGAAEGGYDSVPEAASHMARLKEETYKPIPAHVAAYDRLYAEYRKLHDYFGRGGNDVMRTLREMKRK